MPTINVTDELELFLKSLKEQTYKDFELIAVDQNNDDRAYKILEKYEDDFEIKYMKSDRKGLSLNRNRGLLVMDGEITGFPDDDCEYQPDTLEKVVKFFKENEDKRIYSFFGAMAYFWTFFGTLRMALQKWTGTDFF